MQLSSGPVTLPSPLSVTQPLEQETSESSSDSESSSPVEKELERLSLDEVDEKAPSLDSDADADKESISGSSQVDVSSPYPNIFAVGDAADAFGAINAGHNAYFQVILVSSRVFDSNLLIHDT